MSPILAGFSEELSPLCAGVHIAMRLKKINTNCGVCLNGTLMNCELSWPVASLNKTKHYKRTKILSTLSLADKCNPRC